jgi:hypothetical protein
MLDRLAEKVEGRSVFTGFMATARGEAPEFTVRSNQSAFAVPAMAITATNAPASTSPILFIPYPLFLLYF